MIGWLKGTVVHFEGSEIILNANGVGYLIFMGDNLISRMKIALGITVEIVIYTAVKEDEIRLFGFDSFEARKLFITLLGVNGIGPKVAIKIIDQLPVSQIIRSIGSNDYTPFLQISGVGKKTAQRLVLDLQGKIDDFLLADNMERGGQQEYDEPSTTVSIDLMGDARSALTNLGFSEKEAERVIKKYLKPGIELDELIRKGLGELNQATQ